MPYRIKAGQKVFLVMAESSRNRAVTLDRTIDFTKKELVASPLLEHRKGGIAESPYSHFEWGFNVIEKWQDGEHANEVLELYAKEVHHIQVNTDKKTTTVIIPGSKGNQYTVTLDKNGLATHCSCPAFRFRTKHGSSCKHCSRAEQRHLNGLI